MSSPRALSLRAVVVLSLLLALPALADSRIERDLALEPGGRLIVDTAAGSVEVTGGSRPGVHVVITSDKADIEKEFDFSFEERDGEVEIAVEKKGQGGLLGLFSWSFSGSLRFEIEVPAQTSVVIDTSGGAIAVTKLHGEAQLDTSGGPITVRDLDGQVSADTSGGPIRISGVRGNVMADTSGGPIDIEHVVGNVDADTSGGGIRMSEVTGDIAADTSGGPISIAGAGGRVDADTSGGSIEVGFAAGNQRGGSMSASGGGITVTLDPQTNLAIDAQASGGRVVSALPVSGSVEGSSLRGALGSGGEALRLRSSGGSIRIEKL